MADGLTTAVADIDGRLGRIHEQIGAARQEIEKARRDLADVRRDQAQQRDQLASVNAQLGAAIGATKEAVDALRQQVVELTASIARIEAQARDHQAALDVLLAAQREEKLRKEREGEQANFVLGLRGMLERLADPAVRAVFAADALAAIDGRKISATSFLGPADKKAMSDALIEIGRAITDAPAPDRAEAEGYMRLRILHRDTGALLLEWAGERDEFRDDTAAAERRLEEAQRRLAVAEAPEPEEARRRRRFARMAFAVLAALAAAATLAGAALVDPGFAWGVVAAIALAALAWRRSDAHLRRALVRRRADTADVERALAAQRARGPKIDGRQLADLAAIRKRWRETTLAMPPQAETSVPAAAVVAARTVIARAKQDWEHAHPEVAVLAR